ncbi:hypothetical protein DV515_00014621 [Chloebia gouldiae]|uniref:Uncharacterized protein n=1 Tax=Chloebia gouldiae TaxID=44316 RepID=A0A3L8RZ17_CHLGU|nr:hypothetical protein DV515_00014621 [Chloebia gouldiae]
MQSSVISITLEVLALNVMCKLEKDTNPVANRGMVGQKEDFFPSPIEEQTMGKASMELETKTAKIKNKEILVLWYLLLPLTQDGSMRMELAGHLRSRRQEGSGKQIFPEQDQVLGSTWICVSGNGILALVEGPLAYSTSAWWKLLGNVHLDEQQT